MRPIIKTATALAASVASIAASQTPLTAGNLTLTSPVVTLAQPSTVTLTFAANETGRTFVVYGTDAEGHVEVESLAGTTGSVTSTRYFASVNRISVSAATAGSLTAGNSGGTASSWAPVDRNQAPFSLGIGCVISGGTPNYTVQYTYDDPFDPNVDQTPFNHPTIAAKTANFDGNILAPVQAVRVIVSSGTGSVTMTVVQGMQP